MRRSTDSTRGAFAAARRRFLENPRHEDLRLTGTKHPDSTAHRAEQLERALRAAPADAPDRAHAALTHIEWNPLMEARLEYEESIADLLGPCTEVLLDLEGRQISPDWLDVPEKVVLALLRHGVVPGEDRHLLLRVPNPFLEQDEEKVSKILASVARANLLFLLACERVGFVPTQNAIYEISVPQVNSAAEIGAVTKIGTMYIQAVDGLFEGPAIGSMPSWVPACPNRGGRSCSPRCRGSVSCRCAKTSVHSRTCPSCSSSSTSPSSAASARATCRRPTRSALRSSAAEAIVRVFVAMSDTALQSGKLATDTACTLAVAGRDEAERRLALRAARSGQPAPKVTFLIGSGRAGFRGGFDPRHPGVIKQFANADGVTLQGIRADSPEETLQLAAAFRAAVASRATPRMPSTHCPGPTPSRWRNCCTKASRRTPRRCCASRRCWRRSAASCRRRVCAFARRARPTTAARSRPIRRSGAAGRPCLTIATCATPGPKASRCHARSSTTSPARRSACRQ